MATQYPRKHPPNKAALDAITIAIECAPSYAHLAWLRFAKRLLERDAQGIKANAA